MASQELSHQSHNISDSEGGQSSLQHSHGGREANGDNMPIATDHFATNFTSLNEDQRTGDGISPGRSDRQASSQERQADAQYPECSNSPALGQVCW